MKKTTELELAILATHSADEVLSILNVWQGRISDFWRTVGRASTHWNESLATGAAHDSFGAQEAAANPALPPEIGATMGMWFANRLFGDAGHEVGSPAYFSLIKLAERNMIDGESGAVAILLGRIAEQDVGANWTMTDLHALDILQRVRGLSSESLRLILETLRIRPQSLAIPTIRAKFERRLQEHERPAARGGR